MDSIKQLYQPGPLSVVTPGSISQANAVVFPFYKDLDLNITQDIYFNAKIFNGTDKHTLRLTLDLINVGNFLNKNWGLVKLQNTTTPLTFEGMAADRQNTPVFLPLCGCNEFCAFG